MVEDIDFSMFNTELSTGSLSQRSEMMSNMSKIHCDVVINIP